MFRRDLPILLGGKGGWYESIHFQCADNGGGNGGELGRGGGAGSAESSTASQVRECGYSDADRGAAGVPATQPGPHRNPDRDQPELECGAGE